MTRPSEDHKAAHFTARRGFVAASGFGLVSLYLLWAGYGAAPLGSGGHDEPAPGAGGHGGGHGSMPGSPPREEFRKLAEAFVEAHKLPDGSVQPQAAHHGPTDVYLMAFQWGYAPAMLRLEAGTPYRFRMMAMDVAHGASIHLGAGARIIRLRPGALVEQELVFTRAGEHLVYCTVYCGLPHDRMQGRIVVTEKAART
jgi:heme/copper-type cytochrome/quinol oxidase subunit 2